MTVEELIKLLSEQDPKATVTMPDGLSVMGLLASKGYVYLSDMSEDELYESHRLDEEGGFFADDYAAVD